MNDYVKMVVVLGTILAVSIALLTIVNSLTTDIIKQKMEQKSLAGLKTIFPDADTFVESDNKIHSAFKDKKIIGYIIEVSEYGYSSEIKLLVGITLDKTIKNIFVLEHMETPGLGSKITSDSFLKQFQNYGIYNHGKVALRKDGGMIDGITSATISSQATIRAVNKAYTELDYERLD
jgi:Na+-translocating ferredoxin:NAD+ oxidoreductase subunit G